MHARAYGLQPIDQARRAQAMRPAGGACQRRTATLLSSSSLVHSCFSLPSAFCQVWIDFKNQHGLQREAAEGAGIGMAGKQAIHPSQLAAVQARRRRAQRARVCRGGSRGPRLGPPAAPPTAVLSPAQQLPCTLHFPSRQEAFSPDPHDVEEAQLLVGAFEEHRRQGKGAFTFK